MVLAPALAFTGAIVFAVQAFGIALMQRRARFEFNFSGYRQQLTELVTAYLHLITVKPIAFHAWPPSNELFVRHAADAFQLHSLTGYVTEVFDIGHDLCRLRRDSIAHLRIGIWH